MKGSVVALLLIVCGFATASVDFSPAKLPCAYYLVIDSTTTRVESGKTTTVDQTYNMRVNDDVFYKKVNYKLPGQDTQKQEAVIRGDLAYEEKGKMYYPAFDAGTGRSCEKGDLTREQVDAIVWGSLKQFVEKMTFETVTDSNFGGKHCKKFFVSTKNQETVMNFSLYADDNNFIIGFTTKNTTGRDLWTTDSRVHYDFAVAMKDFVINRTRYDDCDARAYSVPEDRCNVYSSGYSSGASISSSVFDSSSSTSPKPTPKSSADGASSVHAIMALVLAACLAALF